MSSSGGPFYPSFMECALTAPNNKCCKSFVDTRKAICSLKGQQVDLTISAHFRKEYAATGEWMMGWRHLWMKGIEHVPMHVSPQLYFYFFRLPLCSPYRVSAFVIITERIDVSQAGSLLLDADISSLRGRWGRSSFLYDYNSLSHPYFSLSFLSSLDDPLFHVEDVIEKMW